MLIDNVAVWGFRSIERADLPLGPATVLSGRNNSGKSSLIRALCHLQQGMPFASEDVRIGHDASTMMIDTAPRLRDAIANQLDPNYAISGPISIFSQFTRDGGASHSFRWNNGQAQTSTSAFSRDRSASLIVPVLADRRTTTYDRSVTSTSGRLVSINDRELTSRIVALTSSVHPEGDRFRAYCDAVLGLSVATYLESDGQEPGLSLSPDLGISISRMGHGVSATLKLLSELASDRPRLYCLEEPENDLHPAALDAILQIITEAIARGNQFLVSTHSSRVLQSLGGIADSRLYKASQVLNETGIPTTTYKEVEGHAARAGLLEELGYRSAVPHGWLLMEESTAEQLVRGFFIPRFAPRLVDLQTVSARGVDRLKRSADDFVRLAVYAHLADARKRLWALVDGDDAGRRVKQELEPPSGVSPIEHGHVYLIGDGDLESCYPDRFQDDVSDLRSLKGEAKRIRKAELLQQVLAWTAAEPEQAAQDFERSAPDLIRVLREIERAYEALPDLPSA